jgi:hypothetical protein
MCVVSIGCGLFALPIWAATRRVPAKAARKGDQTIRFERDVLPLLTRFSCNAGNCHGATGGKGRLTLSLFGSRPIRDYVALVDGPGSDLIDEEHPKQSLLLRKATNTISHSSNTHIKLDSPGYKLLKRWIEAGTPAPRADDPRIVRLDVLPKRIEAKKGDFVRLVVHAVDNDLRDRDVSREATVRIRSATDNKIAKVLPDGRVEILESGFGLLTVSYSRNAVTIPMTVPYTEEVAPIPLAGRSALDRQIVKGWNRMRLASATRSKDHAFMRRIYLHLVGRPPTPQESVSFIDSKDGKKRSRLIDTLLASAEHATHWMSLWWDWLNVDAKKFTKTENAAFDAWLAISLTGKRSLNDAVTELLTATGSMKDSPAATFVLAHEDASALAETTSRVFLGIESRCFRCHDHPLGGRNLDDYDAFKACFIGLGRTKISDV